MEGAVHRAVGQVDLCGHPALPFERFLIDREAVVLAGDLDATGVEILHRLIPTAMAELQLVGRRADRATEKLMPEADAEGRHLIEHALDRLHGVIERRRITRAVA